MSKERRILFTTNMVQVVELWQSIYSDKPGCAWKDNPWVWVIEFEVV